jgi:hypothetical protein
MLFERLFLSTCWNSVLRYPFTLIPLVKIGGGNEHCSAYMEIGLIHHRKHTFGNGVMEVMETGWENLERLQESLCFWLAPCAVHSFASNTGTSTVFHPLVPSKSLILLLLFGSTKRTTCYPCPYLSSMLTVLIITAYQFVSLSDSAFAVWKGGDTLHRPGYS